jgi:hypothetical protein
LELTNIVRMVLQDNLCVALLPYDLMFQMSKILAIDTAEEQVSARELSPERLKVHKHEIF